MFKAQWKLKAGILIRGRGPFFHHFRKIWGKGRRVVIPQALRKMDPFLSGRRMEGTSFKVPKAITRSPREYRWVLIPQSPLPVEWATWSSLIIAAHWNIPTVIYGRVLRSGQKITIQAFKSILLITRHTLIFHTLFWYLHLNCCI